VGVETYREVLRAPNQDEGTRWSQDATGERGPNSHDESGLYGSAVSGATSRSALEAAYEALRAENRRLRDLHLREPPIIDYMKVFTDLAGQHKIRFFGPQPAAFNHGHEPFGEFKRRFRAHALSAGWSGANQITAMPRYLTGESSDMFVEWVSKGLLRDMNDTTMWALMEEKFSDPEGDRLTAKAELSQRPQQPGESVAAYEQVFRKLANRAELSDNERVDKWMENIEPTVASVVHGVGAGRAKLSWEEAAKIARRAERPGREMRPLQTAVRRTVNAIEMKPEEGGNTGPPAAPIPDPTRDAQITTEFQIKAVQMAKEAVAVDVRREIARKGIEVDDEIRLVKRKLDELRMNQDSRATKMEVDEEIKSLKRKFEDLQQLQRPMAPPTRTPPVAPMTSTTMAPPFAPGRSGYPPRNRYQARDVYQPRPPQQRSEVIDETRKAGACFRCGEQGHMRADCKWRGTCDNCGKEGHRATVCMKRSREDPAATQ